jgi:hypothetical protein
MTIADQLSQAARAVVERWDSPLWKDLPHTAESINALRAALAAYDAAPDDDAKDAARYRLLRDVSTATWSSFQEQWRMPREKCDEVVDATYAARSKP